MILRIFTITLLAILAHLPAMAQSGGGNAQNSLLPDINPQDIEIRSEFKARFPGLRRQPILGFNPKPRVFRIDPDRMPFMESREDAVAGIEVTNLDRPRPPVRRILSTPLRRSGYIRAGIGSYITPEIEAYGFSQINEQSQLLGDLNFRASDGHLEDNLGSFRYMDASVNYVNKVNESLRFSVDVGGLYDFNKMIQPEGLAIQNIGITDKDYTGAGGTITLENIQNSLDGWRISVGGNAFSVDVNAGENSLTGEVNEQRYHASASKYWAGQRMYETFDITGGVEGGRYKSTGLETEQWINAKASLEYSRLLNFNMHISARGGVEYISDAFSEKIYIAPGLKLKHNLRDAVLLTANLYAKPEMQSVQEHHQYNRFLNFETQLRHSYKTGLDAEIAFQPIEGNRIFGGLSFNHIRDYAYYQRAEVISQNGGEFGFYDVNYGDANIFEIYAGITQQLVPEKFWFTAKLYGRSPSLSDGGDIPYEERLGLEGSLSYKPVKNLTISSWAEYVGPRADPNAMEDLNAFALINGGAEYQINERFGVYAKVLNILGQKYEIWNGYEERPFQVFGGLTIKL